MTTIVPQPFSAVYARPLGGLEHVLSLVDQHRPVHFAMAAEIEGPTKTQAWRGALDKLQERHPLLSVAIEQSETGVPHFQTVKNAPIPFRITPGPQVLRWQAEVAGELARPFDFRQSPLVRAVLMYGEQESVFILTTHHSIADGLSSAYAIRDVLRAVAGATLEPLPPMPNLEALVNLSQQGSSNAHEDGEPELAQRMRPEFFRISAQRGRGIGFRQSDQSLPSIETLSLSPEMTRSLIERARKEQTTVHAALCSALVMAGRESVSAWDDSPVRVRSPFSLRKQLGIGEDCGVFVWARNVTMSATTPADFSDMARFAKASLTEKQSLSSVARETMGLEQAVNSGIGVQDATEISAQNACELLLTNLGKVNVQPDTDSLRLKELWGPAVLSSNEQTVGVTTANDSLCLLYTSFTPIPSLLPRAAQILQSVCG